MSEEPYSSVIPIHERINLGPFVYYIQSGMFVKIGTSIDPTRRCKQLMSGKGGRAQRPDVWVGEAALLACEFGSAYDERRLHHRFSHLRHRGEWFYLTEELAEHIEAVQRAEAIASVNLDTDEATWLPYTEDRKPSAIVEAMSVMPRVDRGWIDEVHRIYSGDIGVKELSS